mmetsp:Transcript_70674/g.134546  ORF Transcript_70674/g.134546 Transcript_70674/m.134546 type:complete len:80 (+) Transcript_70674:84-323(+)
MYVDLARSWTPSVSSMSNRTMPARGIFGFIEQWMSKATGIQEFITPDQRDAPSRFSTRAPRGQSKTQAGAPGASAKAAA